MFKRLSKIILVLTMLLSFVFGQGSTVSAVGQDDITTIKTRLKTYFLELDTIDDGSKVETCYVSQADEYLKLIQEDGSFKDVDYQAHNNAANGAAWSPYLALDRLQAIAIAYHKPGNTLYHSEDAKNGVDKAIKNWVSQCAREDKKLPAGPYSTNWWENQVGVQLRFSRIGLFMEGIISEESLDIILTKLIEKTAVKYGTGQNNLWFDQNHVYYALLKNDTKKLKDMVDNYLNHCLSIQLDNKTAEAVQVDNSFYMHGKQFYSNGYGMSMFRDMSFWIYMLRNTDFAIGQEVVDRMADYMLDGTNWTIRGDIMELYLGYRPYKFDVGYQNYAQEYIEPLKRMIVSDTKNASRYQAVLDNIQGNNVSNGKNGNYYMWRSGYASHMRDGYGVNIKMDSKDLIGGEWRGSTQQYGQLIYWTSSAASSITVDGDEYTKVYPTFDWAHVPGTTTANRIVGDFSGYGRFTNGTDHTIGVSNGKYGATAYVMDKKDTQATKGYFFFDDEFVALGAGINSKESVNIHTTLNQSQANNVIVNGETVPTGTKGKSYTGQWLHNDKTGYVFPKETTVQISNGLQVDNPSLWEQKEKDATPETFTAWIDHGMKPKDESYEYIVLPNKTSQEVEQYSKNLPIEIVANTKDVQAVRHDGLKQTQINFYKAGSLEYKDGHTVTVDYPCSIIIDESSATRKITVAVADNDNNQTINVKLDYNGNQTTTHFISKSAPYAGQSMTLPENQDDRYHASSSVAGHSVKDVIDDNEKTYWESQGNKDEWITLFTGSSQFIKDMTIVWGEHYATQYEVYGSKDGFDYQKIKTITDGKGGKENITIGGLYKYIKIVMNDGSGNSYQIKEVTFHNSQLLSLNKTVNVSSTSTNDPGNIKENAVDGNFNTRWSSLRKESGFDKQEEWISVDLGRQTHIDVIELAWEAACSNNYSVEVSNDNKTWKSVKQNLKSDSSLKDQITFDELIEARYVRIHSYSSATKYGISIYELSIYGQYVSTNIALNKEVESSSVYNEGIVTKAAVDGNTETKWSSSRKNPGFDTQEEWISVDLGEISYIDGVNIDWETGCSDDYSIEISDDNKNWTIVKEHLKSNTVASTDKHFIDYVQFDKPLEARYVKIHSFSSRTKWGINIWELNVLGEIKDTNEPEPKPEESNIALNKTSKASSEYLDTKDGDKVYYSSLAFDGNSDKVNSKQSRWTSHRETNDEWIYVDLEDTYKISKIVLDWEEACGKDYDLQVSLDGETWTTISEVRGNSAPKNSKHNIREYIYDQNIYARYVKMQGITPAGKYGYSLWEFEVYGDSVSIGESENSALNRTSKASSEYLDTKDGNKVYYSSLAFDGSTDKVDGKQSRWVSNRNSNDEWIYVDLHDTYDISKVVLNWEGACGKEYKIQVSENGEDWTDISHVTDGKPGMKEFTYDIPATGRYVRMLGIIPTNGGKYGYSLWEFEVYGVNKQLHSDLNNKYNLYKTITNDNYTSTSYANFNKALLEAENALSSRSISDINLIKSMHGLENAHKALTKIAQFDELQEIIKEINQIDKSQYTSKSIQALEDVLKDANNLLINKDATQDEVDEMTQKLIQSKEALIKKANKDVLMSLIEEINQLDENDFTPNSWEILEDVLVRASDIVKDEDVLQNEVDNIVEELNEARDGLMKKADKTTLQKLIEQVEKLDKTEYVADSYQKVIDTKETVQKVLDNENATESQVTEAIETLQKAIDQLVKKTDKKVLNDFMEEINQLNKNDYTSDSWNALQDVLDQANNIIDDEDAVQNDVDIIVNELKEAKAGLVKKADKTLLQEFIKKVESLDHSSYTADSYQAVIDAKEAIQKVLDNENATEDQVKEALNTLQHALDSLVIAPTIDVNPDEKDDTTKDESNIGDITPKEETKGTNTSDMTPIIMTSLILIGTLSMIIVLKKKKEL